MKPKQQPFSSPGHSATGGNFAQLLIQAQEQKCLAQKLLNIKPSVDNREPKRYVHHSSATKNGAQIER